MQIFPGDIFLPFCFPQARNISSGDVETKIPRCTVLTLSHMCFHKRKHFSLTTVPFSPRNLGVRDGPGKLFAVFSFGEDWRSVPLSILLSQAHAHTSFLLPAEGCIRRFPLAAGTSFLWARLK